MRILEHEFRPPRQREIIRVLMIIVIIGLFNIFVSLYAILDKRSLTIVQIHQKKGGPLRHGDFKDEISRPLRRLNRFGGMSIERALDRNLVRNSTCSGCFPYSFERKINNPNICQSSSSVDLLILITSSPRCRSCRDAIRETWLQQTKNSKWTIRYAFLLGVLADDNIMNDLTLEAERFNDIIMHDFQDSYYNLTLKTMTGLKWASQFCNQAKYIMKTDDDVYVYPNNILEIAETHENDLKSKLLGSCVFWRRPIREEDSKWYVSRENYPWSFLPPYCSGTGYLLSMPVLRKALEVSVNIPFFHLEDVYVGLCMMKLWYSVLDVKGFNTGIKDCVYRNSSERTMHFMFPERMKQVWHDGKFCLNGTRDDVTTRNMVTSRRLISKMLQ